jgi:glutamine amidotransferase
MITIIDYGLGNILAFQNVYERFNIPVKVARTVEDLSDSRKLILPGVGSFDSAMRQFTHSGLRQQVENLVLNNKVPILGICVGMQMLANRSEEGQEAGLGWIDGYVAKLKDPALALPHMGWNDVKPTVCNSIFSGVSEPSRFYFLHSYCFTCNDLKDVIATTHYGETFCSAVGRDNIFGVQFHPEKSHRWGGQLLKAFAKL